MAVRPTTRALDHDGFGSASVLEAIPTVLFDSNRYHDRQPPTMWRAFCDSHGKTSREFSPHIVGGGSLAAPRIFVVRDFRLVYQPEEDRKGKLNQPMLRSDVERLKSAFGVQFTIGVRNYYEGPAALLPMPFPRGLTIPPQQAFYIRLEHSKAIPLNYSWRVYAQLRGELGFEVT